MLTRRLRLVDDEQAPAEGPSVRVAIATQDMKALDAHFGSAKKFAIYDVTTTGWTFVEAVAFENVSAEEGKHGEDGDDRITPKVRALEGCQLLFCRAIGGPAAARVVAAKIHPVKMPDVQPIDDVLGNVRTLLNGSPPPWLRKVLAGTRTYPTDASHPAFAED